MVVGRGVMIRSLVREYMLRNERRRLRLMLRWIKRAEHYYMQNCADIPNLGMCVSFASTRPWWVLPGYRSYSDAFSLLFTLCPEFNYNSLTSRFPNSINSHASETGFWWELHMSAPRLDSFAYLKGLYIQKLKSTRV